MIFQTESEVVRNVYSNNPNCKIICKEEGENDLCAIYFASHDIYYPNREEIFRERIVEKDSYEWFHTRIERASKHIYLRDIFKQWYLEGIKHRVEYSRKVGGMVEKGNRGV